MQSSLNALYHQTVQYQPKRLFIIITINLIYKIISFLYQQIHNIETENHCNIFVLNSLQ